MSFISYIVVDWSLPKGEQILSTKPIFLTKWEMHDLNKKLFLNKKTERYIRAELGLTLGNLG